MTQRFNLFCGIDVGKASHTACLLDADGRFILRSQSFNNDAAGFALLLEHLAGAVKNRPILLGMEATGHYWYALHDHLTRLGRTVVVLNPVQTAQQAKKQIRKRKTDKVDARHIATLLKNGDFRPALIPGELGMTCRQLSRLWHALLQQRARLKQLIRAKLECIWPEFEAHFADSLCVTARAILRAAPSPQDLLGMQKDALTQLIEKASRKKLGAKLAQRLQSSAQNSIGMRRGLEGARLAIHTLMDQLDVTKPVREQLKEQIVALSSRLPGYVLSLPGIDEIRAVSLFGETDPVSTFRDPEQLVAFAGLDLVVYQTGQYEAPHRKISKRGSPHLRRTLWTMASVAVNYESELRDYYLRRRRQGLHHLAAVTAVAIKLTRAVWRILTDQRDYHPEGRPKHQRDYHPEGRPKQS
ncbi:MAG: IS110 family transposase [Tepidisphaeraceae bacterium]